MAHRPIFYDTETTGIKSDSDKIIELAAYDPILNRTFEQLINPQCPIPPEASAIHRITDEMVANMPTFGSVAQSFIEFCQGEVILIAHNNDNFDLPFLRKEFARANVDWPEWRFVDSLKWARRYRNDLPRHSLQFLREYYSIPANNAHRALDDVVVLEKIFSLMVDDLSIGNVYDLLNQQRQLQHMPFGKHQGKPLQQLPKDYIQWLQNSGAFNKAENADLLTALAKLGLVAQT